MIQQALLAAALVGATYLSMGRLATVSAPATTVTAAFTASKVQGSTCVAPCAVHFDAVATSDTDYSRTFHTHSFDWTFGDSGAGSWTAGATTGSRNTDMGPIAGHVYYTPGTYTVDLVVRAPDGDTDTESQSVTVADPDATFTTTSTVCIAASSTPTAGSGGCPSGAAVVNAASDFDAALSGATCNADAEKRRCLFKKGDTFASSAAVSLFDSSSPGLIGAYGTGAAPIVTGPTSLSVISYGTGWTVTGITFQPGANSGAADYINLSAGKSNQSFIANTIENRTGNGHAISTASASAVHNDLIAVADNTISRQAPDSGTLPGAIFVRGARSLVSGNTDDQAQLGTTAYNFRTVHFPHSLLAHNTFTRPGLSDNVVQLRSWGGASPPANDANEYIVVASNKLTATNPSTGGFVKLCQTNTCDNTVTTAVELTDVLIERNFMALETGGTPNIQYGMVQGQGGRVTVRNNVFDMQGADFSAGGSTSRLAIAHATNSTLGAGAALIDDEWHAYNNTFYYGSTGSRNLTLCDSTSIGTGHYCVGNLLVAISETGTKASTAGTGFTSSANNVLAPGSSPFVGAISSQGSSSAAEFDVAAASAADGTGFDFAGLTVLWNLEDFGGTNRAAPWDAGAWGAP